MSHIAYVSNDPHLPELFKAAGLKSAAMTEGEARNLAHAAAAPSVLVIDVRPHHTLAAWLGDVLRRHSSLSVLLIVSTLDARFILEAMRAGVKECLPEPLSAQALDDAVKRLVVGDVRERAGQLVAFIGAKGGVGTTTLAANTAAAIARTSSSASLLVDLHITRGDAAVFLGAETRFSVLDALENLHKVDESFLAGLVEKSAAGVDVLASSSRLTPIAVPAAALRTLLDFAARRYRVTVVDVPRTDLVAQDALDAATAIVLVTSQDLSAVRSAAVTAAALRQRYGSQRLKLVINRFDKSGTVTAQDVARVVGEPVAHTVASDYRTAVEAINAGRPVTMDESRLSKAIRQLATDVTRSSQAPSTPKPAVGMLGRLAWRRA